MAAFDYLKQRKNGDGPQRESTLLTPGSAPPDILPEERLFTYFASCAVPERVRSKRGELEQILRAQDMPAAQRFFIDAYRAFCREATPAGDRDRPSGKADPRRWGVGSFTLTHGAPGLLCYMPIHDGKRKARLILVVLGDGGEGCYFCTLNEEESAPSELMRSRGAASPVFVARVRGKGSGLLEEIISAVERDLYARPPVRSENGAHKSIVGFSWELTGESGILFYRDGKKLCSVTRAVMPDSLVHIQTQRTSWRSFFALDATLIPGHTARKVVELATGREACQVTLVRAGFLIALDDWRILAQKDAEGFLFAQHGRPIARLRYINESDFIPKDPYRSFRPAFAFHPAEELPEELLPFLLAFPLLCFA